MPEIRVSPTEAAWVVVYQHKFGTDVFIAEDEEVAHEQALSLVRTYREDFNADPEDDEDDLLRDWCEVTGGQEFIDVVSAAKLERVLDVPPPEEIVIPLADVEDTIPADADLSVYMTQPIE
jgi:hypothetical protein